ncbi:MAG TPA: peptidoglycan DD-metalloendopeptidase family protein [Alphaproteobacteria bacterium]|nr:peptidoglycan DD-metalloendopeptidase family protein [Alphaproteobacteria bacterium]
MWRIGSPEPYAPAARVIAVLAVLVAINLFIRDGGLAIRDLNRPNDPLYYAQQDTEEEQGPPSPITLTASIERGDTLAKVLAKAQVPRADAFAAVDALRKVFNPRDLKPGQEIELTFKPGETADDPTTFMGFWFEPAVDREIAVVRGDDGKFQGTDTRRPLAKELLKSVGTIDSSLFADARSAGIPAPVIIEAIRAFSFDIDFQRELQPGATFEVAFERYATEDGQTARVGDLIYARLATGNKDLKIYRYLPRDGTIDYFNNNGESVRKALLRTPVDGARITSKFTSARMHPLLGFTRAHKGVDFGVPQGTPIMAAGSGVVVETGFNSGYGNYVRLRHNPTYSTMYAHMSRIGRGITRGARVSQGQTIGFVGMTGLATGPHLHYEVLVNNVQVNPLGVKLISGQKLRGADLQAFERAKKALEEKLVAMPRTTLASQ